MHNRQLSAYLLKNLAFLRAREWLLFLCLITILGDTGLGLTNPIVPLYAKSFGVSLTLVGFFITTFAIGRLCVNIPAGRAADRWGRLYVIMLGPFITGLAALGQAKAINFSLLLLFRFFQGAGSALYLTGGFLLIADLSLPDERGRTTSLFQGSSLLGLTVSPAFGGILANHFGLRAPFYVHAFIAFLVGLLIWRQFPKILNNYNPKLNQQAREHFSRSSLNLGLFSDTNFLLIALVGFIIFVSRSGSRDTLLPLVGEKVIGLDIAKIGFIFTVVAALNLVTIPLAGVLSDKFGRKPLILLGLFLNGLGLGLVGIAISYSCYLFGVILMGAGKGFSETSSIVYVTDISQTDQYGATYGLFLTLRDLGLFFGPISLGWIADVTYLQLPLILNSVVMILIALLFGVGGKETLPKIIKGSV